MKTLPSVAISRFVAALWVFLFHISTGGFFPDVPKTGVLDSPLIKIGYVGVTFFFVLSGYILARTSINSFVSTRVFYLKRLSRIYPAYIVSMIVALPLAIIEIFDHSRAVNFLGDSFEISNYVLLFLATLDVVLMLRAWIPLFNPMWNPPAWSLSCEAFFYLVFPVAMSILVRHRRYAPFYLVIFSMIGVGLNYFVMQVKGVSQIPFDGNGSGVSNFVLCNPLLHLHEFLVGISCGIIVNGERIARLLSRLAQLWVCLGLSALACLTLLLNMSLPYLLAHNGALSIFWGGVVVLVGAINVQDGMWSRVGVKLGEASYCFYLIHFFILQYFNELFRAPPYDCGIIFIVLVALASCVLFSLLLHEFVEIPARRYVIRKLSISG